MIDVFRVSISVRDDAGKTVKLLDPAGMSEWPSKGDARIAQLVKRLRLIISRSSTFASLLSLGCIVVVIVGYRAMLPLVNSVLPHIPGVVHLVVAIVLMQALIALTWRSGLYLRRNEAARLILAEGLCPSCGYNFAGLGFDQGAAGEMVSCPECGAAWKRHRIIRIQGFDPAAPMGLPTALVRKRVRVSNWSVLDDRGVPLRLVHPGLRRFIRREDRPERLARLEAARRGIAPSNRWLRVPMFIAVEIFAIWCFTAAFRTGELSGTIALSITGVAVMGLGAAMYWGNFLYSPRTTRRLMLEQELCPSCAGDLRGVPVHADGCAECRGCGGAWRITPPTEAPSMGEPG